MAGGSFISYRRGGGLDLRQPFRQGQQHLQLGVRGHPAPAEIAVPLQSSGVFPAAENPLYGPAFVVGNIPLRAAPPDAAAEQPDIPFRVFPCLIAAGRIAQHCLTPGAAADRTAVEVMPRIEIVAYVLHLDLPQAGRHAVCSIDAVVPLAARRSSLVDNRNAAIVMHEKAVMLRIVAAVGGNGANKGLSFRLAVVTVICNGKS